MSSARPNPSSPRAASPPVWSATLPSWALTPEGRGRRGRRLLPPWRAAGLLRRRRTTPVLTRWTCVRCGAEAHSAQAAAAHLQACHEAAF